MARSFFRKLLTYLSSNNELDVVLNVEADGESSRHRGNRQRRKFIRRDHIQAHQRLFHDYFAENPVYPSNLFRRTFRMSRPLFLRILNEVEACEPYFVQRRDNAGRLGLSSMQKITAALRMLAYGVTGDFMDEYIHIGESTAMESLKKFCKTIVTVFSDEYLRSPNANDITRLLVVGEQRGFPGMLGSIDCMHWKWKIVPLPGKRSFIFTELAQGRAPLVNYTINGSDYTMGYYLADGIYPKWSTFVKTIPSPQGNKKKNFTAAQESARKDVERAFGVLQQRFAIVRGPSRFFKVNELTNIMKACVILHNMIIEDERDDSQGPNMEYDQVDDDIPELSRNPTIEFINFIQRHHEIRNNSAHHQLQADLIEHE
ncbi:uncharacterized protein LOC121246228 [Juglans microcarpa x Juglans regia]|uniref:uncharacterized protein LOC121246228 n=1 Tax=Juglans microcarpa x Juglans regia TaxID=2249226 RepID=UPI001B7F68D3|nr:uncharacterized protein LOC121246228 [Juglans microcarpa x Juglans regia]